MSRRQRKIGMVTSDKMDKSIVVMVERLVKHPLYKKYIKRRSRFMAHDERNEAREGDIVLIEETRPISKRKRWRLVKIIERVKKIEGGEA